MSRRNARELVLHMLFDNEMSGNSATDILSCRLNPEYFDTLRSEDKLYSQIPDSAQNEYINDAVNGVISHCDELDGYIEKYSSGWAISRISNIAKCILRLSMFEMKFMSIPIGASVNEAIELSKRYDSEDVAAFINGILASFVKNELADV